MRHVVVHCAGDHVEAEWIGHAALAGRQLARPVEGLAARLRDPDVEMQAVGARVGVDDSNRKSGYRVGTFCEMPSAVIVIVGMVFEGATG